MSNYVKAVDFAAKDTLATGNAAKAVKGTEINTEFDAIATMSGTKADKSMTTALLLADGTVSAPGLAFVSDTGTGIYRIGAQNIGIAAGGRLGISQAGAGNVTIAAPSSGTTLTLNGAAATNWNPLAVGGTTTGYNYGTFTNTAGSLVFGVDNSAGGGLISGTTSYTGVLSTTNATPLALGSNNIARVILSTAGNVTIATPGSGSTLTANIIANTANAFALNDGTGNLQIITDASHNFYIGPTTSHALNLRAANVTALTIGTSGNVTIAAPSSGAALIVTGSASTPINAIGNSSTAFTIDFSKSNVHTVTMTGNVAGGSLTLSNAQDGQTINVFLTQDGTGSRTLAYPAAVKWPSGTAGVLSTAASSVDLLTLTFRSATGFYYANLTKAYS